MCIRDRSTDSPIAALPSLALDVRAPEKKDRVRPLTFSVRELRPGTSLASEFFSGQSAAKPAPASDAHEVKPEFSALLEEIRARKIQQAKSNSASAAAAKAASEDKAKSGAASEDKAESEAASEAKAKSEAASEDKAASASTSTPAPPTDGT